MAERQATEHEEEGDARPDPGPWGWPIRVLTGLLFVQRMLFGLMFVILVMFKPDGLAGIWRDLVRRFKGSPSEPQLPPSPEPD